MAEYQMVVDGFLNEPLTGRRPIETPETEINRSNVLKVVMGKAEPIHLLNKNEIRFLHNYYLGSQPVLHRTKEYHAEITNRIVENHANECVGFYTGYMSGTPCSYVRSETATGDGEEIARLSNALQYEGKDALDRRLWQWMLECGQGYRIVLPDKGYNGNYPDETPLLVDVPDPDMAYVVYNSGIGHKPIANVLHIPRNYQNDLNDLICVYTPNQYFEIDNGKVTKSENHSLGMLPMVEYKLNPERMGLFEPAIPVLDAINDLESNRLDGVAQFIQSIMVFTNCLVDEDALNKVKELGAMCLKSTAGLPASVSQIANELDQQQSQTLLDSMLNVYRSLTAMPSATGSENATSDNVGAVIVRNGWNHTEARAQQYENMFKFSERQSLSVMLKILRDTAGSKLMASDINIKLPRRQYDNQQSTFKAQEIWDRGGVYYGQNAISKNLIVADRKRLLNGNAFILGVSGSGKSFSAKKEMVSLALSTDDDIIIIDPESEYRPLVEGLGGQVINISATSPNHINAMDMEQGYGDGENPVVLKSEFLLSLCEQLIGDGKLSAKEKSIIDRCTAQVYRDYIRGGYQGQAPTLQDFHAELLRQPEKEAQDVALAIELFTDGSLNTFAKPTNVDTNARILCYDIRDLGKQLLPVGMLVVLDSIFNRIIRNRGLKRNTWIYIDEIYLLFQHEYSANFLFTLWKRMRKYQACGTGISQNIEDLLQSHAARTMLANSEFLIMLNQAATDREELAHLLNISDNQLSYITNVDSGRGLIKCGSAIVPFVDHFPKNKLYRLMTTKPSDLAA